MNYVFIILTALFSTFQNIFKQKYNERCSSGAYFFSGMTSLFSMLFFAVVNRDWGYRAELLLPSGLFAISYATATVFAVLAFQHGSLAKTSLIISYSLLIPTGYGMIALKEPVGVVLMIGLILLVLSIWLANEVWDPEEKKTSRKWLLFVALAFSGNGMCSLVQKWEQIQYGTAGQNMFMIVALAMVTVVMLAIALGTSERHVVSTAFKKAGDSLCFAAE